jgi:hypothetical protein
VKDPNGEGGKLEEIYVEILLGRLGGEGDEKRGVRFCWTPPPCSAFLPSILSLSLSLSLLFPETTKGLFSPCLLYSPSL